MEKACREGGRPICTLGPNLNLYLGGGGEKSTPPEDNLWNSPNATMSEKQLFVVCLNTCLKPALVLFKCNERIIELVVMIQHFSHIFNIAGCNGCGKIEQKHSMKHE